MGWGGKGVFCLYLTHFLSIFFIVKKEKNLLFNVLGTTMGAVYVSPHFSSGNDFVQFCLLF